MYEYGDICMWIYKYMQIYLYKHKISFSLKQDGYPVICDK